MTKVTSLKELRERFEKANKLILEHPSFDSESRSKATEQSAIYMLVLDKMLQETDGEITTDINEVLNPVIEFLDLVDEHCAAR